MTSAPDPHDDPRDLDEARHVAAHAVAHLHFGQRFGSLGAHAAGWWEVIDPIWGPDPVTIARVSLAGACMDLAVDLIEDGDSPGVGPWLESWRDDVAHHSHGYRHDMVAARGGVADAASWSLAFCRLNFDLIDELAMMLVRAEAPVDYAALAARFRGRTVDVDADALQAAEFDFAGQTLALERVDDAVAAYLATDGTK
jgi:hypothetical protein